MIAALRTLLRKHIAGTLTRTEKKDLLQSLETVHLQPAWKEIIAELSSETAPVAVETAEWEPMIQEILASQSAHQTNLPRIPLLKTTWFRYAAAIVGVLVISTYLWTHNSNDASLTTNTKEIPNEIQSGTDGAILTLADGTQVILDGTGNRLIATQNGSDVKMVGNQLTYELTGNATENAGYNTMQTPKGKQFKVQLPDGTNVWLNAESSIRYPTVFNDSARNVATTGEVYFEVARNTRSPFSVTVANKMHIEVLGTNFNIQAYLNEPLLQATLLEGSIKVNGTIIKPGQQAQMTPKTADRSAAIKVVNAIDVSAVMAWKTGLFDFRGKGLEEVMRQLERWYNIEVLYPEGVPTSRFDGKISREASLADVLDGLKRAGVHFRIEGGRRIIITP